MFQNCEEQPIDIPPFEVPESDKVVLIEDFTGVQCVNCPNATRQIESLIQTFPGNVVAMAIHTDALGSPLADSKFDFRTEEGNLLESDLGTLLAKPVAVINRKPTGMGGTLFNYTLGSWSSAVSEELSEFAEVTLTHDIAFDPETRLLNVTVGFTPKQDIDRPLRLTAAILESNITDPQIDIVGEVPDYVHDHVLRHYLSNYTGDDFTGSFFQAGETYTKTYEFTIPEADGWWKVEDCSIVAFVTEQTADSRAVLQAMETYILE